MPDEYVSATRVIDAPAEAIFAVLADPATHGSIDGTGWVREPLDGGEPLAKEGQVFKMAMYHPQHPDGNYEIFNQILVCDPPRAIGWKPGYDAGEGKLGFGGWFWRYDLVPAAGSGTRVTLTYDWSQTPPPVRERFQFPDALPPGHLDSSLGHLAALVRSA